MKIDISAQYGFMTEVVHSNTLLGRKSPMNLRHVLILVATLFLPACAMLQTQHPPARVVPGDARFAPDATHQQPSVIMVMQPQFHDVLEDSGVFKKVTLTNLGDVARDDDEAAALAKKYHTDFLYINDDMFPQMKQIGNEMEVRHVRVSLISGSGEKLYSQVLSLRGKPYVDFGFAAIVQTGMDIPDRDKQNQMLVSQILADFQKEWPSMKPSAKASVAEAHQ